MSQSYTPYQQGPPQGPGGYPAPPNAGPRFPTYTPAQQRGPSPPQNLGQRPPNAGGPQQYQQMHPGMHQQQTVYTYHVPQGGNMSPPNTMQYHLLPGGGGAHPAAFQPLPRENAHADDKKSSNANDNADRICWTCHKELVCLKKNICAGCFKARYCDEECRSADWARHGEYCVLMQQKIRKKKEAKKLKEDLNALKI